MNLGQTKVEKDLMEVLDKLTEKQQIDVLVYPEQMDKGLETFLQTKKAEGVLDYNVLRLANCVVVKASKKIILEIATREDVSRVASNPQFTAH